MFEIGGTEVSMKCPKCGGSNHFIGTMTVKNGKMAVEDTKCLDCNYEQEERFEADLNGISKP